MKTVVGVVTGTVGGVVGAVVTTGTDGAVGAGLVPCTGAGAGDRPAAGAGVTDDAPPVVGVGEELGAVGAPYVGDAEGVVSDEPVDTAGEPAATDPGGGDTGRPCGST